MVYVKHKRSITAIILIFIAMLFVSADKKMSMTEMELHREPIEKEIVVEDEESIYVSERLGKYAEGELEVYMDQAELLFEKFEVRYEYRDYIRQLCEIYNIPVIWAISVAQIETHNGKVSDYNVRADYRMYYMWDKETKTYLKTWDIGYFQNSTQYLDYWRDSFFNPELIFSLGYVRESFTLADDVISSQIGIAYLDWLLKYYRGDQKKATMAYNTGMVNVNNNTVPDITVAYEHAIRHNWKYRERDI